MVLLETSFQSLLLCRYDFGAPSGSAAPGTFTLGPTGDMLADLRRD
jgi:hypothetical protein